MSEHPSKPKPTPKLYCSFCGKSQDEVICLIAGPTVFICDECVAICVDVVSERRIKLQQNERTHRLSKGIDLTAIDEIMCAVCGARNGQWNEKTCAEMQLEKALREISLLKGQIAELIEKPSNE